MESKQKIKERILKRAARVWGYTDAEVESNFDPIVALLLEALGAELEKQYTEIDNTHTRLVERLIEVMSPASYAGAQPAHAIVHALPLENEAQLSLDHQFLLRKTVPNLYQPGAVQTKELFFGPSGPFVLSRAQIEYVAFANTLYQVHAPFQREAMQRARTSLPPTHFWMGIRVLGEAQSLGKLMFYTDTRNQLHRDFYFHNLQRAQVRFQGRVLNVVKEAYNHPISEFSPAFLAKHNYPKLHRLYHEVNTYYQDKFFYLDEVIALPEADSPDALREVFGEEAIVAAPDLLWLEVQFPETMRQEVLEEVHLALNCFPVLNKQLRVLNHSMDPHLNYIPLETQAYFLDLESITDSQGNVYHAKSFRDQEGRSGQKEASPPPDQGYATLRNGGVARMGQRSAADQIQYLLDLLQDEAAAFASLGSDFVKQQLKQLQQLIAALEQELKAKQWAKQDYPYLMLRPQVERGQIKNDFFTIKYWTTSGEDAQDIKPGTRLSLGQGTWFEESSIAFLTATVGGHSQYSYPDKVAAYREALLSHGRVVTIADIKAFVLKHFGQAIQSVEVRKGTEKNQALKKGFVRTLEIILERNPAQKVSEAEWEYLCRSLVQKLQKVSSNVYPYKIREK